MNEIIAELERRATNTEDLAWSMLNRFPPETAAHDRLLFKAAGIRFAAEVVRGMSCTPRS